MTKATKKKLSYYDENYVYSYNLKVNNLNVRTMSFSWSGARVRIYQPHNLIMPPGTAFPFRELLDTTCMIIHLKKKKENAKNVVNSWILSDVEERLGAARLRLGIYIARNTFVFMGVAPETPGNYFWNIHSFFGAHNSFSRISLTFGQNTHWSLIQCFIVVCGWRNYIEQ